LWNQLWSAASKNLLLLLYVRTVLTASTESRLAENMTAEAVDDDYIDEDAVKSTSVVWVLNNPVLFRFVEFMPLQSKGGVVLALYIFLLPNIGPLLNCV
jgi:hypothetical protein